MIFFKNLAHFRSVTLFIHFFQPYSMVVGGLILILDLISTIFDRRIVA